MVCGWLHVEEGAVVRRDGAGNPCRMRPGRDPAAARARAAAPEPVLPGRAAGRGCTAPLPAAFAPLHVQPAPLLAALQMGGTAWGSGGNVPVHP